MRGSLGRRGAGLQQVLEGSSQNLPDLCCFPLKLQLMSSGWAWPGPPEGHRENHGVSEWLVQSNQPEPTSPSPLPCPQSPSKAAVSSSLFGLPPSPAPATWEPDSDNPS